METLTLHTEPNGIAVIRFQRPGAMNAFTAEMLHAFPTYVAQVAAMRGLRAVILCGDERAFSSGGDLHDLNHHRDAEAVQALFAPFAAALLSLERLPVPVIAAINGYALGGGAEIALACDLRVIDSTAKMGFPQSKWALMTGWGGGQRLLRHVGYARAMHLLLTAATLSAQEMLTLGLAQQISDVGQALPAALQLAQHIAQWDQQAVSAIKASLQAGLMHPYDDALRIEAELFPALWQADAHWQAKQAFFDRKRDPRP
jgi:enoyl-CoA hydratase